MYFVRFALYLHLGFHSLFLQKLALYQKIANVILIKQNVKKNVKIKERNIKAFLAIVMVKVNSHLINAIIIVSVNREIMLFTPDLLLNTGVNFSILKWLLQIS